MAKYIREREYNEIKKSLDNFTTKVVSYHSGRGLGTIYQIKNTQDYNEYRHKYQGRICPCPEHRNWSILEAKMDELIPASIASHPDFLLAPYEPTNRDIMDKLDEIQRQLNALSYLWEK
jgi:tetrahydromethanopterin S-methyltransferase subunit G